MRTSDRYWQERAPTATTTTKNAVAANAAAEAVPILKAREKALQQLGQILEVALVNQQVTQHIDRPHRPLPRTGIP